MVGPSDVVYVEKRRGPRTNPWGTPVTNLCALDTFPPQATLKDDQWDRTQTSEVESQCWEGGQKYLMIDCVKSGREIQQNEDWLFGIGFCNSQGFSDWESLSWMATPEAWLFSVQFVVLWKKQWDLVEDNSFECFGYEWKERDRSVVF